MVSCKFKRVFDYLHFICKAGPLNFKLNLVPSHSLEFKESKFLTIPESKISELSNMFFLNILISNILDEIHVRNNRDDLTNIRLHWISLNWQENY